MKLNQNQPKLGMEAAAAAGLKCWVRRQQCPCGELKCIIRSKHQHVHGDGEEYDDAEEETSPPPPPTTPALDSPFVGQTFQSDDDAFQYYSNFAKTKGFAIRRESSKSNQRLGTYRRELVCYRAGVPRHRKSAAPDRQKNRKSTLCECQAKMTIVKDFAPAGPHWTVKKFTNVHNHDLLKDHELRLLPAYRKIPEVDRHRILLLRRAGYSTSHIMKILGSEKGGDGAQLPFLDRDVRNFIQSSTKKSERRKDAMDLVNMCRSFKEKSVNFVYEFTLGEDAKLENLAWTYGDALHAYEVFGDVVLFDATFRETTYDRVLGVWFGVDNHGKIIFFAAALLQDETSASFAWGMQTFIRLMKGRYPLTILTDLGFGLRDAITNELPHTKHAFCVWHIFYKLSSWFYHALGSRYEEFKSEFSRLYNSEVVKDFECQWSHMLSCFGLDSNNHIALLSAQRASWALSYVKGFFHAGLTNIECSNLMEDFLEEILGIQTGSENIFEKVGSIANFRYQRGEDEMEDVQVKTSMPMEEHASNILTRYAFNLLQPEITASMQCAAFEMPNGLYLVRHHKQTEGGHLVSWTPRDEKMHCTCKEFEFRGILCRHALRVLALKNYFHIPEKYLLFRWRQESSLVHKISQSDIGDWPQAFHSLTATLYAESLISKERIDYVQKELTKVLHHVKNMQGSDGHHLNFESDPPIDATIEDVPDKDVGDYANSSECESTANPCH